MKKRWQSPSELDWSGIANEARSASAPKGRPKIARRFNAGNDDGWSRVPKGRLRIESLAAKPWTEITVSLPSLRDSLYCENIPGVETPGYSRLSLQDCGSFAAVVSLL